MALLGTAPSTSHGELFILIHPSICVNYGTRLGLLNQELQREPIGSRTSEIRSH